MERYIHKSKSNNGVIWVRIISKKGKEVIKVEHIGTAHNEKELNILLKLAEEELRDKRQDKEEKIRIIHKRSYSKYLFEGNKAKTKTMIHVLKAFREKCKLKDITVVAAAAMLSAENLDLLEENRFNFIKR
jgi:hypothetical protein